MKDILKAKLATDIHFSYKDKEDNFREMPQFLTEETEDILQWIKENTSEEARNLIIAVENNEVEIFKRLAYSPEKLKEEGRVEDLYTTIVVEESIEPELLVFLFLTRRDVKQFILSLLGDIKTTKVLPIAIMLIDLLHRYEEATEFVKEF